MSEFALYVIEIKPFLGIRILDISTCILDLQLYFEPGFQFNNRCRYHCLFVEIHFKYTELLHCINLYLKTNRQVKCHIYHHCTWVGVNMCLFRFFSIVAGIYDLRLANRSY